MTTDDYDMAYPNLGALPWTSSYLAEFDMGMINNLACRCDPMQGHPSFNDKISSLYIDVP
jgi:hypothetical protein